MTVILISLLLQIQIALPERTGLVNPASIYSVSPQIQKDYDKLWKRFLGGKEDTKVSQDLARILKKNPEDLSFVLVQAYLDLYSGRPAEAEGRLEFVLSKNPADPVALTYLADFAYTRSDYVRASELYTRLRAINTSGSNLQMKSQRSLLLAMEALLQGAKLAISENRSGDAQKLYQQALNLTGNEPALRDQLNAAINRQGTGQVGGQLEDRQEERSVQAQEATSASTASIEDLGRWGNQIDHFREIRVSDSLTREQLAALLAGYFPELDRYRASEEVIADVQQSWAQSAIRLVVGVGLLDSMANHTFQPSRTVTRGEFAGVLSRLTRLFSLPASTAPLIRPRDVVPDSTLYLELQPVLGYELMTLDNAGNFNVRDVVRGEEAVNIAEKLHRLLRKNTG